MIRAVAGECRFCFLGWGWTFGAARRALVAQSKTSQAGVLCPKKQSASSKKASEIPPRAWKLAVTAPQTKGEWGLLMVDAESGDTLYDSTARQ